MTGPPEGSAHAKYLVESVESPEEKSCCPRCQKGRKMPVKDTISPPNLEVALTTPSKANMIEAFVVSQRPQVPRRGMFESRVRLLQRCGANRS